MTVQLLRLMESYEFLKGARARHAGSWLQRDLDALDERIDQAFLDIVRHESSNPQVTLAQVQFLMTRMAALTGEPHKTEALQALCQKHFDRLTRAIIQTPTAAAPEPLERRYLDAIPDRIGIVDTEFRYTYTNPANTSFHKRDAAEFIGRPNWDIVGRHYFERRNKSVFEACLVGRSFSHISAHPCGDPDTLFMAKGEPVRDSNGRITGIMVVSRLTGDLPIPPDMVTPLP